LYKCEKLSNKISFIRSILLDEILIDLQKIGRANDIHVNFIDIACATSAIQPKRRITWSSHLHLINSCFHGSSGTFFLSLLGDSYGLCPIPTRIDQMVYELTRSQPSWAAELGDVVDGWYILDENSIPPQYVLTEIEHVPDGTFWTYAKKLRSAFENIILEAHNNDIVVGNSVTDFETRYAVSLDPSRCHWIHRKFSSEIPRREKDFCDTWKDAKKNRHVKLSKLLQNKKVPCQNISCDISINVYKDTLSKECLAYSSIWKTLAMNFLLNEVEACVARRKRWISTGNGVGIPGPEIDEMVHHCQLAAQHCDAFRGRKSLVDEAIRRIKSNEKGPGIFPSISLCLGGSSGNGKGALVSHLVAKLGTLQPSIPRIVRFCCTSAKSSDNMTLLINVCLHIQTFYQLPSIPIPATFEEALSKFQDLLKKYAVILFFVDIDLVKDVQGNPIFLRCLKGVDRHADSRVIITFSDVTKLGFDIPAAADPVLEISAFSKEKVGEALLIMQDMMQSRNRKLTNYQWDIVLNKLSPSTTSLYMFVGIELLSTWISTNDSYELPSTVSDLVNEYLDEMETKFGKILVKYALGYLTIANSGTRFF